jgi:penicillin-binding protein 1A
MTSMLEDVINHGTGYPNAIIGRPAAGKTGTTSDFRDAWFVGYTPDLVTAVWLGNDNYSRMNESYGGNIPARIWARFMKGALVKVAKHDFTFPEGEVVKVASCSGGYEYYLNGTQPVSGCGSGYAARYQAAQAPTPLPDDTALPSLSPPPATLAPDDAPPPNSISDGTKFAPLGDSPAPQPTATTKPRPGLRVQRKSI